RPKCSVVEVRPLASCTAFRFFGWTPAPPPRGSTAGPLAHAVGEAPPACTGDDFSVCVWNDKPTFAARSTIAVVAARPHQIVVIRVRLLTSVSFCTATVPQPDPLAPGQQCRPIGRQLVICSDKHDPSHHVVTHRDEQLQRTLPSEQFARMCIEFGVEPVLAQDLPAHLNDDGLI